MADSIGRPSSETSDAPISDHWPDWWTSSLRDSRVSPIASRAKERVLPIAEISGPIPSAPLAKWGPNGSYLRMYPGFWPTDMLESWSGKFPRSGMTVGGMLYQLPKLERPIIESAGSALPMLPTPAARDYRDSGMEPSQRRRHSPNLAARVMMIEEIARGDKVMFPTPLAGDATRGSSPANMRRDSPSLLSVVRLSDPTLSTGKGGLKLNPRWVEWLMGLPIGWTGITPMHRNDYQRWYLSTPGDWWEDEIAVARVCEPSKGRISEIKALGNGIVPATVARFLTMVGVFGP